MARILLVLGACCAFLEGTAQAQTCGGRSGSNGTRSVPTTESAGSGATMLTGPGSLAYDVMMSQMMAQRAMQQRQMLAMQQQAERQQRLERTRYRAEKMRSEKLASRERTRAGLAAESRR